MVARWIEGFETHQNNAQFDRRYATRTGSFPIVAGRVFGSAGTIGTPVWVAPSFGLADTWGIAFGLRVEAQVSSLNSGFQGFYIEKGTAEQVHLEIVSNAGSFELRVMRGATQLGITTSTFALNAWHHFELKVLVHTSTGTFELRHNEVNVLSGSGVNTANAGSNQADVFAIRFTTTSTSVRVDDFLVWDGTGSVVNNFQGDTVVEGITVTGAGATTQWTPSAGSNFQNVDDPGTSGPVDTGTGGNNSSDTAAQVDLYAFSDLTQIDGTIIAVQLDTQLAMASAGSRTVDTKYRDPDTTVVDIASKAVTSTSYDSFHDVMSVNPNGGAAWDVADINGGQFGVEIA
jgi:hypothetical protein